MVRASPVLAAEFVRRSELLRVMTRMLVQMDGLDIIHVPFTTIGHYRAQAREMLEATDWPYATEKDPEE